MSILHHGSKFTCARIALGYILRVCISLRCSCKKKKRIIFHLLSLLPIILDPKWTSEEFIFVSDIFFLEKLLCDHFLPSM